MAATLTRRDLLIVLLSGGASSLWPAPVEPVSLAAKQRLTTLLLRSGATIGEINVVRKHLSRIKGGRLAALTAATVVTLILSDVIGDDVGAIGSGPTAPDVSTFTDAVAILRRHRLWARAPSAVRRHLLAGRRGVVPETRTRFPRRVHHAIIGNNQQMLTAVARAARAAGFRVVRWPHPFSGEAREAAGAFAEFARRGAASRRTPWKQPICVIAGGEPTVAVTGRGIGGRAQEFAVAAALRIAGLPRVWVAAFGTDGTDGPTEVAGALVSGQTMADARRKGIDLERALARHDTYPILQRLGCHIVTGPTGTNVNDLYLMLLC
jgi:glycerate-2-kinase